MPYVEKLSGSARSVVFRGIQNSLKDKSFRALKLFHGLTPKFLFPHHSLIMPILMLRYETYRSDEKTYRAGLGNSL